MSYQQLINTKEEFYSLSRDLLDSTENTFDANLLSFKDFCESNEIILSITKPILNLNFDGIEYFNNASNPSHRLDNFPRPKKREEYAKVALDLINDDSFNVSDIYNYAIWALCPSTNNIDELTSIGSNNIFGQLIKYIDLQLTKLTSNAKEQSVPNSITYNIGTAHDSIIGNQTNATINNSNNLDELRDIINDKVKDHEEKEQLQELITMIKAITEANVPVSKGVFSKFSDTLQKNSWVTGPIATTVIKWLIG